MRLLFVWASAVVPVIAAGEAFTLARVTGNAVNLRAAPSVGAPALGKVSEDEHLVVCGTTGDWVRVYLPKRLPVFVSKDDIARAGEDAFVERPAAVRMEPDRAFAEVGKIPPGTNVKLIRQYGVWWAIEPPLSLTAYVNSQYVKGVKALSAPEAESVLGGRAVVPLGAIERPREVAVKPPLKPAPEERRPESVRPPEEAPPESAHRVSEGAEAAGGAEPARPLPGIELRTWTEAVEKMWKAFLTGRNGRAEEWDFTEAKNECARTAADGRASAEEKEFAATLSAEIKRLEDVKELLLPKPRKYIDTSEEPERREDKPLAVGWVIGQGRYLNRPGTHALMNGDKVLCYLEGKGTDLDAFVNRRIAVLAGTIEDLPPQYGCRLIKVERARELSR
ncbi:MAG TPA: hypothetical protein PKX48_13805 [Planctomycetota bacterium]|jgi:hypothetical protein|nr:hypothetical protein [Planctomycetota bacterium]OQC20116.1 MAG: Bacterial SH3 domain protein [Planctomycetes bacterium ADurb.Bin069]NMD34768.1 hypothetical protein [Planctomycetota bacterium]HNS00721.1 hypothetical protein [Planctomycetota bacterium]HOE30728.1 hypothetical protein [Planctomycetota bacterium]